MDSDSSDSEVDSRSFVSQGRFSRGSSSVHACPYPDCPKFFSRPSRLKTHIFSHTGERPFQCRVQECRKTFARKEHLKRHQQKNHACSVDEVKAEIDEKTKLPCPHCPSKFANKYSLKKHQTLKHKDDISVLVEKPYKCTDCNASFQTKIERRRHRGLVHPDLELPYICEVCQKRFLYPKLLREHQKHQHQSYSCKQCDKSFEKWTILRKHIASEHRKKEFKCNLCPEVFKSRFNFRSHQSTHQNEREVFRCQYPMCKRWYTSEKNLRWHVVDYHKNGRFKCPIDGCDVRLNSRASKGRHIKTCHGAGKNISTNLTPLTINSGIDESLIKKCKKPRKDIGLPKLSVAAELSGLGFNAKNSRTIIENSGKTELSKEELVKDICDNKDVKKLLLEEPVTTETEPENENICSDVSYNNDIVKDDPELLIFPRRVQNILETDEDITDLEETPSISVINEKEDTSSTKRYDFSYFLS